MNSNTSRATAMPNFPIPSPTCVNCGAEPDHYHFEADGNRCSRCAGYGQDYKAAYYAEIYEGEVA